jgi:hypothetical protein
MFPTQITLTSTIIPKEWTLFFPISQKKINSLKSLRKFTKSQTILAPMRFLSLKNLINLWLLFKVMRKKIIIKVWSTKSKMFGIEPIDLVDLALWKISTLIINCSRCNNLLIPNKKDRKDLWLSVNYLSNMNTEPKTKMIPLAVEFYTKSSLKFPTNSWHTFHVMDLLGFPLIFTETFKLIPPNFSSNLNRFLLNFSI